VPDVEAFPGHIACDARSQSEIVVPLRDAGGNITGVLDIDSSEKNSFDEVDARWLQKIVKLIYA
jgi:GAF domain-containing protein